jgi:hypothetical protein
VTIIKHHFSKDNFAADFKIIQNLDQISLFVANSDKVEYEELELKQRSWYSFR